MKVNYNSFTLGCDDRGHQYLCYVYDDTGVKRMIHVLDVDNMGKLIDRLKHLYEHNKHMCRIRYSASTRRTKDGQEYIYEQCRVR